MSGGTFQADATTAGGQFSIGAGHETPNPVTAFANLGILKIAGFQDRFPGSISVNRCGQLNASSLTLEGRKGILNVSGLAEIAGPVTLGGNLTTTLAGQVRRLAISGPQAQFNASSLTAAAGHQEHGQISVASDGKMNIGGEITIGSGASAQATADVAGAGSELRGNHVWIGKTATSTASVRVADDGTLRADQGVALGAVASTGTSDASLLIGGPDPAGGFFGAGPVNAPHITRSGDAPNISRVLFHSMTRPNTSSRPLCTTAINAGTLFVNGSIFGSSSVEVRSTLSGSNYVRGPVYLRSAGVISPGYQGLGTLRIRNLVIDSALHSRQPTSR